MVIVRGLEVGWRQGGRFETIQGSTDCERNANTTGTAQAPMNILVDLQDGVLVMNGVAAVVEEEKVELDVSLSQGPHNPTRTVTATATGPRDSKGVAKQAQQVVRERNNLDDKRGFTFPDRVQKTPAKEGSVGSESVRIVGR